MSTTRHGYAAHVSEGLLSSRQIIAAEPIGQLHVSLSTCKNGFDILNRELLAVGYLEPTAQ